MSDLSCVDHSSFDAGPLDTPATASPNSELNTQETPYIPADQSHSDADRPKRAETPPPSSEVSLWETYHSTPIKEKVHVNSKFVAPFDRNTAKEKQANIRNSNRREVLGATIYDDPHLLTNKFPDSIFEQGFAGPVISPCRDKQTSAGEGEGEGEGPAGEHEQDREHQALARDPDSVSDARRHQQINKSTSHPRRSLRLRAKSNRRQRRLHLFSPPQNNVCGRRCTHIDEYLHFMSRGWEPLYDVSRRHWNGWPTPGAKGVEESVANYLNLVVNAARRYLNGGNQAEEFTDDWVFSAKYANKPVDVDRGAMRKPDIVLIPRSHTKANTHEPWESIRTVGELKSKSKHSRPDLLAGLIQHVRLCFGHQPQLRFRLAFTLLDTKMALWQFDRSGVIVSPVFDIHEHPLDFLRVILGLALAHDYYVGYDPSFTFRDQKMFVELNAEEYEVLKVLQADSVTRGRGTVVLRVKNKGGKDFVLKDQWVDVSRATKEFEFLKGLEEENVRKVPRVIDYQKICFNIGDVVVVDSTYNDRSSTELQKVVGIRGIETRDHYRILISPYGENIESFRSLKELVSIFKDVVEVIRDLRNTKAKVIHRDISLNNIILVQEEGCPRRKGYLIDFDYAIYLDRVGHANAERTGTGPFMAIEVLLKVATPHEYFHDIESLFYVLLWICCTHDGPGKMRCDAAFANLPVHGWVPVTETGEPDAERAATVKSGQLSVESLFKWYILDKLPAYFRESTPFLVFLKKLRKILFQGMFTPLTEEVNEEDRKIQERDAASIFTEILKACEEAITNLPDEPEPPSSGGQPEKCCGGDKQAGCPTDSGIGMGENRSADASQRRRSTRHGRRSGKSETKGTDRSSGSDMLRSAIRNSQTRSETRSEPPLSVSLKRSHGGNEYDRHQSSSSSKRHRRSLDDD